MKRVKVINITQNETRDAELTAIETHNPPLNIADVASISQSLTYRVDKKPGYWKDTDEYKIIEV